MGKKKKRKRRSDERGNSDSSALSEDGLTELRLKLITTITRKPHRLSRIKRLLSRLDRRGSTINHQDAQGQTLLHLAASCGHNDVVMELLRQGADASIQDHQGNTAAHLAALRSHLLPLTSILQISHPPDIDSLVNQAGTSIRMATDHMLSNNQHNEPGSIRGVESMRTTCTDDHHAVDTTAARDGSQGDNQEEEWQQRLREEYSDGEGGRGVVWGAASGRCDGYHHQSVGPSAAGMEYDDDVQLFATMETEDEWAERLWREMQARRKTKHRQQSLINQYTSTTYPAASGAGLGSRSTVPDASAAEMAAAAAAARQRESDRILQEEQQKDAAWRHKASSGASSSKRSSGRMPGPTGPSPCPTYDGGSTHGWGHQDTTQGPAAAAATLVLDDPSSMRDEYEAKWRALEAKLALMKHPDANKKHHASTSATAPQVKSSATAPQVKSSALRILKVDDIPWPIPFSVLIPPPSAAAYQHVGRNADSVGGGNNNVATQNPNHYKGLLADVLIWGASGVSEVKARLRMEIMRWHPDKFMSRFGALFPNNGLLEVNHGAASATGDVLLGTAAPQQQQQQILKGVDLVAQQITQLMGSLPLQVITKNRSHS